MPASSSQVAKSIDRHPVTPSVQAGNASAENFRNGALHVTPPRRTSLGTCCGAPPSSRVMEVDDWPAVHPSVHAVQPPALSKEHLQEFFTELRDHQEESFKRVLGQHSDRQEESFKIVLGQHSDRQEESFKRVLDQQEALQNQLSAMALALKTSTDSQALRQTHHDDCIAEVKKLLTEQRPILDIARFSRLTGYDLNADASKKSLVPGTENDVHARPSTVSRTSFASKAGGVMNNISTAHAHGSSRKIKITAGRSSDSLAERAQETTPSLLSRVSQFLKCKEFQLAIGLALLVNAFLMCWEAQYHGLQVGFDLQYPGRRAEAWITWPGAATVFKVFDWFFGLMFFAEMAAKVVCWRSKYFFETFKEFAHGYYSASEGKFVEHRSSPLWHFLQGVQYLNLLDFFCVIGFVVSKVASAGIGNPQLPRLLRLFRFGRLVRLLRFVESLDHLYQMTTALAALKDVLSWAIALLTLMLLTCDLFLIQILHSTYFDNIKVSDLTEQELRKHHEMYMYFGTWTRCILSMFELTLGNWPPVARLLTEQVSEWFIIFTLAHKLTFGFAVLGVINGVILQETFKVAATDDLIMYRDKQMAKETLKKKFQGLFEDLDQSGDGRLEISEIERIGELPEIRTWLGSLGIETHDLRTLFELIDADGNGYVTIDELLTQMPHIRGAARSADVLQLLNIQKHIVAALAADIQNPQIVASKNDDSLPKPRLSRG